MKIVLIVVGAVAGAFAVMFLLASVAITRVGEDMRDREWNKWCISAGGDSDEVSDAASDSMEGFRMTVVLIVISMLLDIAVIFFVLSGVAVVKKNISDTERMLWRDFRS